MRIIKKAVKILGFFACGFIVFLIFYLALTKEGGYYDNIDTQKEIVTEEMPSEELQKLSELQKNALNQQTTSKLYASKCSACHGKEGEGVFDDKGANIFPAIAAKPYEFILKRVYDYKEQRVPNPLMATLLKSMKDEDLKALADEISKFQTDK
ncbi:MAG: hypothetical protein LBS26_04845 [Campylobacteraceae bacterium]|jgi:cytochrome c553|nr:hypothetical protein [Campylobacteraceae bacterium]